MEVLFGNPPAPDARWTVRDDETNVVHEKLLGEGGYGEVHQVRGVVTCRIC
jgi:hypothetical protein